MTTTLSDSTETTAVKVERGHNAFETAQRQFDRVADTLGLDQPTRDLLRSPLREYHFSIPIRMDDGSRRVFRAESKRKSVRMRDAAYSIAVKRVARACRERGWV
jgi:glutamate dehydrogenase/leucine dehydrogenase